MPSKTSRTRSTPLLQKSHTGIEGLDQITGGGFPQGRSTLICGGPGCGKTMFGLHFLIRGALDYDENGVFMSFEERPDDLSTNVASLGFDIASLVKRKKIVVDHVRIERAEIEETGSYDLEGIFVRLGYAIDSIGAKRVVLDTIEALFAGLSDHGVLRAELRRLFGWLKDRGVTSIITGERGDGTLTRQGLEEYVSDCVIVLDNRVQSQISTRRLRIVKYRGSAHGTNEYPFLIDQNGIAVLPVTSAGLRHDAPTDRVSSGIPRLDHMLSGSGYYRGSSILVSGAAGTGKSTVATHFVDAACSRGERALYFAFEESDRQIIRNMRSVGIDLQKWVDRGLLTIHAARPTSWGLESHLVEIHRNVAAVKPRVAVFDPVSGMAKIGSGEEVREMLMRLLDDLKVRGITTLFTTLTTMGDVLETSEVGVSSLMDAWILLREIEVPGERNRALYILKCRGLAHSNQVREFVITSNGIQLHDVCVGAGGVLTGSARIAQQARDREQERERHLSIQKRERIFNAKKESILARIAELRRELEVEKSDMNANRKMERKRDSELRADQELMASHRKADTIAIRKRRKEVAR